MNLFTNKAIDLGPTGNFNGKYNFFYCFNWAHPQTPQVGWLLHAKTGDKPSKKVGGESKKKEYRSNLEFRNRTKGGVERETCNGAVKRVPESVVCIGVLASEGILVVWYCR